ncbi:MAG: Gfo/Idh/MocA family oxidoreductase [Armatimonadetes bacterium]|nr:Gfo/Idh/MocA family oxidoreductase [Armatimonadota bacterium]
MERSSGVSRRDFLRQTAATAGALALPTIIPASAWAQSPGAKLTLGFIGTGGRGQWLADAFMGQPDVQVVAVSDVDRGRVEEAKRKVEGRYAEAAKSGTYKGCTAYRDFREMVARTDIDAVVIASPDHWHALHSVGALRAGKHVYCEKPLANSVGEGRAIADAVKATGKTFQVGSHERSTSSIRHACELVRNGRIGQLKRVKINLPCDDPHHKEARTFTTIPAEEPIPDGFDYDTWLGHTPKAPYCARRCHFWWRFNLTYGGGEMTDRGAHVLDIAQLGANLDNTGPVKIEAKGVRNANGLYNAFWDYNFTFTYANGLTFEGSTEGPRGLKFEGTTGSIFVAIHGGALTAEPAGLLDWKINDQDIQLGRSPGHQRNFLDSIKSGKPTMAPAEAGHRTASLCHLANIAMAVGRPLAWDPAKEQIAGDAEASALLMPKMRAPWHL